MFLFWKKHFVFILIQNKHLFFPNLINITRHYLTDNISIFLIKSLFLKFKNTRSQSLTKIENGTTTKAQKLHFINHLFSHFIVFIYLLSCTKCNLHTFIFQFIILYDCACTKNFAVASLRVDNHVIVLISSIHLSNHATERIFQDSNQCRTINRLQIFEFRKGLNKIYFLFFSHFSKLKIEN